MADTSVQGAVHGTSDRQNSLWGPYWINVHTAVIVFNDDGGDISFAYTTDAGATWTTTEITAGSTRSVAAYFDRETPSNTGTLVHVVWADATDNIIYYITVDVDGGTKGTQRTVDSGVTVDNGHNTNRTAITKTVGGNLLLAFSTQTEVECYRSTDSGANWTDRPDVFETATEEDWVLLFPAATADNDDACALFWDRSADEISVKMYDDDGDSGNGTWTETSISGTMVDSSISIDMDGSTRHSDSHLLLAAHNDSDATTDDIQTWDLTVNSIASPTITAKTTMVTNVAESAQIGFFINQQNDDVYVAYLKGGTWEDTTDVVYHKSTDGMGTWDAESAYSEATADDVRMVRAGRTIGVFGGRLQWCFYNDDLTEIFVSEVNDVVFPATTVANSNRLLVGVGH